MPRRVARSVYAERGSIASITVVARERRPIFGDPRIATAVVNVLHTWASKTSTLVHAYCVMPDHVHLLLSPGAGCDTITFVGEFKNLAQRAAWARGAQGRIWQRSFWDRFLRDEREIEAAVRYILDNPVRQGLSATWRAYPFSGALQRPDE